MVEVEKFQNTRKNANTTVSNGTEDDIVKCDVKHFKLNLMHLNCLGIFHVPSAILIIIIITIIMFLQ